MNRCGPTWFFRTFALLAFCLLAGGCEVEADGQSDSVRWNVTSLPRDTDDPRNPDAELSVHGRDTSVRIRP